VNSVMERIVMHAGAGGGFAYLWRKAVTSINVCATRCLGTYWA
jgi:signal transduction histidine kinase